VNRQAVEAVKRAVGDRALVSASVGPCGQLLEPFGDTSPDAVEAAFAEQIEVLASAGADVVCIETMGDLTEAVRAVTAAKAVAPGLPVMATMTFEPTPRGYFTVMGVSVERAARGLEAAGADVVGSNCGTGIADMVAIARLLREATARPVLVQPNAGLPEIRDGEVVYRETPRPWPPAWASCSTSASRSSAAAAARRPGTPARSDERSAPGEIERDRPELPPTPRVHRACEKTGSTDPAVPTGGPAGRRGRRMPHGQPPPTCPRLVLSEVTAWP
jgi:S-methylmethionine-dependent homocysteine/selenocysteine methylase